MELPPSRICIEQLLSERQDIRSPKSTIGSLSSWATLGPHVISCLLLGVQMYLQVDRVVTITVGSAPELNAHPLAAHTELGTRNTAEPYYFSFKL